MPELAPCARKSGMSTEYPSAWRNRARGSIASRLAWTPWRRSTAPAPGRPGTNQPRSRLPEVLANGTSTAPSPAGAVPITCGDAAVKARVTTPQDVRTRLEPSNTMFRTRRRNRTTIRSPPVRALAPAPLRVMANPLLTNLTPSQEANQWERLPRCDNRARRLSRLGRSSDPSPHRYAVTRQDDARYLGHRFVVGDEAVGLGRRPQPEILRPPEADRLVPEIRVGAGGEAGRPHPHAAV